MQIMGEATIASEPFNKVAETTKDIVPHVELKVKHLRLFIEDPKFLQEKHGDTFQFTAQLTPSGTIEVKLKPIEPTKSSEVAAGLKKKQNAEFRAMKERHAKEVKEAEANFKKEDEIRKKTEEDQKKAIDAQKNAQATSTPAAPLEPVPGGVEKEVDAKTPEEAALSALKSKDKLARPSAPPEKAEVKTSKAKGKKGKQNSK